MLYDMCCMIHDICYVVYVMCYIVYEYVLYVILSYVLCCVILCHAMSCHVVSYQTMSYQIIANRPRGRATGCCHEALGAGAHLYVEGLVVFLRISPSSLTADHARLIILIMPSALSAVSERRDDSKYPC